MHNINILTSIKCIYITNTKLNIRTWNVHISTHSFNLYVFYSVHGFSLNILRASICLFNTVDVTDFVPMSVMSAVG
jgi:hypothetical protein